MSVLFDTGARRLLARAYAHPGTWQGTRIAAPSRRHRTYLAARGIDPDGPDNPSGGSGRLNARTRWARGFVRSLEYNHHRASGLVIEVGRALPARGVIPAGRAVRVRVMTRAKQWVAANRSPGQRWDLDAEYRSDPARRDW